jgi:hypothetical protein
MQISANIRQVIQIYVVDTGTTTNYLVLDLGGGEQQVEVSEEQVQEVLKQLLSERPQTVVQPDVAQHAQHPPTGATNAPEDQRLQRMRDRARTPRTVPSDERGYPIPPFVLREEVDEDGFASA